MSAYLNELIELYLNDIADYDNDNLLLAESVLNPVKHLLTDSENSQEKILFEAYKNGTPEQKTILKDFFLYIKEV